MLEKINLLSVDTMNLIIYVRSGVLKSIIKDSIKNRFEIQRNVSLIARTDGELKDIKSSTIVEPFGGGTWFVEVETEEISIKEIRKAIDNTYNSSITVYWVENYGTFKRIQEIDSIKKQGLYTQQFYMGRLDENDIYYMQMDIVKDKSLHLPENLMKYLIKNYTYDIDAVCDLFVGIKNGLKIKTKKDIIKAVGLGGNTVDSFIIKLLTMNPKTEKGMKKIVGDALMLLNDLNSTYDMLTIKRFMLSTIDTIIELKQLQVSGKFNNVIQEIPPGYNEFKIKRLRRFYRVILEEISVARVLNLKVSLETKDIYNVEVDLLKSIIIYLSTIKESYEKHPEKQEEKSKVKRYKRS